MSNLCIEGIGKDMGSQVLIPLQAVQKGIIYFQETFVKRNRIERLFREMKEMTKRFYNNVNPKTLKCLEELVTAIAAMHNIIRAEVEEVILTCQYPWMHSVQIKVDRIRKQFSKNR